MPTVSVIIPLYNKSKTIERSLKSVFCQTLDGFEVIIVDDGSEDNSFDIVKGYNDKRLKIIKQKNAGPGSARNRGVYEATAKYVAFLDADDEWLPSYLEASYETLERHPTCDICVAQRYINLDDTVVESGALLKELTGRIYDGWWQIDKSISDRELEHVVRAFHTDTFFIRRQLFLDLKGFSEVNHFGEDWYLWIQAVIGHPIYFLKAPLATIHAEASGICSQGLKKNPIQAYFIEASKLKAKFCDDKKDLLDRFFAIHALKHAHVRAGVGNYQVAEYLISHFPGMKKVDLLQYILLRAKLLFPRTYRILQSIKNISTISSLLLRW